MATTYLSPIGNEPQIDANGNPLNAGKIYTYQAGTTTPIATYMDNSGAVGQMNPIQLNPMGLPSYPIWLPAGQAVKLVIQDANGVTLRTVDNVTGINDPASVSNASEWIAFTGAPTYINATSFSVGGDQTPNFQVGRRLKSANTAGTVYGSITGSTYNSGTGRTTVTVANDSGSLDSGLSQVSYSLQSVANPSLSLANLSASGGFDFRNRLHNGSFRINQRNVSGTVTLAAGAYGFDRWKAGASGCTFTFAASNGGNIITITAGSLMQVVEDKDVEGGIYTLVNQGTAQARIAVNGAATSGSYAAASLASPLQSASANGGQTMTVEFSTGTLDRAQLEPGSAPTSFERRPMQVELALCQRFLPAFSVATGGTCGTGVQGAASTFQMLVGFPVTTRVPPNSVVVSSGNAFTVITASTIICTGVTFTAASQSAAEIQLAVTGTAGQGGVVRATGAITYRFEGAEL